MKTCPVIPGECSEEGEACRQIAADQIPDGNSGVGKEPRHFLTSPAAFKHVRK